MMKKLLYVDDINDSRVCEFFSLKDKLLKKNDLIIVESPKVVLKLFNSKLLIKKLFASAQFYQKYSEVINKLSLKDLTLFTAEQEVMKIIVGHKLHHGVMALAERPSFSLLKDLDQKILILNGLTSPENVGTIIRNAAAFGIFSVIIDSKTCSPFARRCIRVSIGNIFRMKVHYTDNLQLTLGVLKSRDYTIYSTANITSSVNIDNCQFKVPGCLIIGSEGYGIEQEILEVSDHTVRIPIDEEVAHLNAACSSSIFLYRYSNI